jgi:hypothetical protein
LKIIQRGAYLDMSDLRDTLINIATDLHRQMKLDESELLRNIVTGLFHSNIKTLPELFIAMTDYQNKKSHEQVKDNLY